MAFNLVSRRSKKTVPVNLVTKADLDRSLSTFGEVARNWVDATGFDGAVDKHCILPGQDGTPSRVLLGIDEGARLDLWAFAGLQEKLPEGRYEIETELLAGDATRAALGWALATYRFDRYKKMEAAKAELVWPGNADRAFVEHAAEGTFLARDLINIPGSDLRPTELEAAAKKLAKAHKAKLSVIRGDDLLKKNYPAIHAVGRGAADAPRLIDFSWGKTDAPKVTLVGKGVCFDTGGYDIKPAGGMLNMKKDMGGSAHVLALASMIMNAGLNVRLRVLIPAVMNMISGNAFLPKDILSTRKGTSVEVGNTDAEGRLILCDALYEACAEKPEFILDYATLTGAARVALGADVPALFCNDDDTANAFHAYGEAEQDPLWRLPLYQPYTKQLKTKIADISSTGSGGLGGAITAALFLEHFIDSGIKWAHIDLMAFNSKDRPGRPEGGEAMTLRAAYRLIETRFAAAGT